jgi:glutamyl-tRNA reductase
MAAAAVRLAVAAVRGPAPDTVLFVGAGEMIELAATHFAARSRSRSRGQPHAGARRELAARFGGRRCALPTCRRAARVRHRGLVHGELAADHRPGRGRAGAEGAPARPMFMVDLAVPRDIEPEVGQLSDVYLYTVDDLSRWCRRAARSARPRSQQAEAIIDAGVQSFAHWLDQRAACR